MSDIFRRTGEAPRHYRIAGSGQVTPVGEHVEELVSGYVLGALDLAEHDLVERHLRVCSRCDRRVAGERNVIALLPFAAASATPTLEVKVALLARIAHSQRAAQEAALPVRAVRTLPPAVIIPASRPQVTLPPVAASESMQPWLAARPASSRFGRAASYLTVPLLMALIATGAWGMQLRSQVAQQGSQVSTLQETIANFGANALSYTLTPTGDSEAQGVLQIGADRRDGLLTVQTNGESMNQVFELMKVNRKGELVPVTKLDVKDGSGTTTFPIEDLLDDYTQVKVQAKPVATGSEDETVLSGDLNGAISSENPAANSTAP
ncbi:MAG: zf-HC2 domain-containing protein [Chloroflexota bacterium]|nr:zf-HC2 domain-containing protein [Chloroflexota bacterium]